MIPREVYNNNKRVVIKIYLNNIRKVLLVYFIHINIFLCYKNLRSAINYDCKQVNE